MFILVGQRSIISPCFFASFLSSFYFNGLHELTQLFFASWVIEE